MVSATSSISTYGPHHEGALMLESLTSLVMLVNQHRLGLCI